MRVIVCDRLSIVRHGLSALLEAEEDIDVIDATGSGIDAMVLVRRHQPHVVVTGLALDGISGLELVRRLNQEDIEPKPRVVVLSMMENEDTITRVLHAGASGLLVKEVTREQLGSAVRAAADGQTMLAPQVTTRLVDWFRRQEAPAEAPLRSDAESLTAREREVLTLFARGLTIDEVASELFIGTTTVRTHVYRLRCKLGLKDRAQLVSFAYRAGLMQEARQLGPDRNGRPPGGRFEPDGKGRSNGSPGAPRDHDGASRTPNGSARPRNGAARRPEGGARRSDRVARTSEGAARTTDGVVRRPEGAARRSDGVARTPDGAARTPEGVVRRPEGAARTPEGVARRPDGAARTPEGVVRRPDGAARTPEGVARAYDGAARARPGGRANGLGR